MSFPRLSQPVIEIEILSQHKKLRFHPFGIDMERTLLLASDDSSGTNFVATLLDVIKGCCNDEINVESLTIFDLEWIFIQLRRVSVSDTLSLSINGPKGKSKKEQEIIINVPLSDCKHDDIPKAPKVDIPGTSYTMQLKFPSAISASRLTENSPAWAGVANHVDRVLDGDEVYDVNEASDDEKAEFFGKMTSKELSQVIEFTQKTPQVYIDVPLPNGKTERLRGLTNFFVRSPVITP